MKLPACRTALLFFLFGVLTCGPAMSAPASFEIDTKELPKPVAARAGKGVDAKKLEIDLNELRAELARKAKAGKSAKAVKKRGKAKSRPSTASVAANGEYSHYTVQRGDHIALILVRHYGLKESEARKLMPEVMRLNSIHGPKAVAAGKKTVDSAARAGRKSTGYQTGCCGVHFTMRIWTEPAGEAGHGAGVKTAAGRCAGIRRRLCRGQCHGGLQPGPVGAYHL